MGKCGEGLFLRESRAKVLEPQEPLGPKTVLSHFLIQTCINYEQMYSEFLKVRGLKQFVDNGAFLNFYSKNSQNKIPKI